jgi:LPXTG-site transpeptidase (sortase) family protein
MLDLEHVARAIDEAVAPVTADEARARAGSRTHFRRTAILISVSALLLAGVAIVAALIALGVGRHSTVTVVGNDETTTIVTPSTAAGALAPVRLGDPIGKIVIPRIDVDWVFVQGASLKEEADGPMHNPASPMPGEIGNVEIAGHRTTHGAPFYRLDELKRGDVIQITTLAGGFTYIVDRDPYVIAPQGDPYFPDNISSNAGCREETRSLTLIANHPRYSAAERLVVTARIGTESVSSCAR